MGHMRFSQHWPHTITLENEPILFLKGSIPGKNMFQDPRLVLPKTVAKNQWHWGKGDRWRKTQCSHCRITEGCLVVFFLKCTIRKLKLVLEKPLRKRLILALPISPIYDGHGLYTCLQRVPSPRECHLPVLFLFQNPAFCIVESLSLWDLLKVSFFSSSLFKISQLPFLVLTVLHEHFYDILTALFLHEQTYPVLFSSFLAKELCWYNIPASQGSFLLFK